MGNADLKTVFKAMVRTVATRLSVHRFAQRGLVLHKSAGSNVALVEFQLSDETYAECSLARLRSNPEKQWA